MQVINKIDQLITELSELKPKLLGDAASNEKKFNTLLKSAMHYDHKSNEEISSISVSPNKKPANAIPSWVNQNYFYDPQNPRKPNMLELMEAISGKKLKDLYADKAEQKKINSQASEILYGVLGANEDTRDWTTIMESQNIVKTAQEQTRLMYEPKVDIISNYDSNEILIEQIAVVKDLKGNVLTSLSDDISKTEETLNNFGATNKSIPKDIESRVDLNTFNTDLLTFLKGFDQDKSSAENVFFQTATEAISNKLSTEIPLEEFLKL